MEKSNFVVKVILKEKLNQKNSNYLTKSDVSACSETFKVPFTSYENQKENKNFSGF